MKKKKDQLYREAVQRHFETLSANKYHFTAFFHEVQKSGSVYVTLKTKLGIRSEDDSYDTLLQAFWRFTDPGLALQYFQTQLQVISKGGA